MNDLHQQMQTQIQIWEKADDDRAIFLKCYAMMTYNMLQAVADGDFQDGVWVKQLTHVFAGYYFNALADYDNADKPAVWHLAFETACKKEAHVLQNLLMGVNAHICYDLIFAVADNLPNWSDLSAADRVRRQQDYQHVNQIIGQTLDAAQASIINVVDTRMGAVDMAFGRLDEWMIHKLITHWRDEVWGQAVAYMQASPEERPHLKAHYAQHAEERGQSICGQRGVRGIIDLF